MIEIKGIYKSYSHQRGNVVVLKDVCLSIEEGEYIAITGPSGGGKSTLLSILGLLDEPDTGSYRFFDRELTSLSASKKSDFRNRNLGFIFQSFHLLPELDVFDNVALPLLYAKVDKETISDRVNEILIDLNIAELSHKKANELSGGQQQRVAIARALVNSPKLLLVDEPTGNLDSKNGDVVMSLLDKMHKEGSTIILVTHDLVFAKRAQRIVKISDGVLNP